MSNVNAILAEHLTGNAKPACCTHSACEELWQSLDKTARIHLQWAMEYEVKTDNDGFYAGQYERGQAAALFLARDLVADLDRKLTA